MIGTAPASVYPIEEYPSPRLGVDDVSPRETARVTDASRLSFPLQLVISIVVGCVTIVGGQLVLDRGRGDAQLKIQSDVRDILTRMEYESKMKTLSDDALEQRLRALEAKIETAGLRNANMVFAQELQKQKP